MKKLKTKMTTIDGISKKRTAKQTAIQNAASEDLFPENMDNELKQDLTAIIMLNGNLKSGNIPLNGDIVFMNAAMMDGKLNSGASMKVTAMEGKSFVALEDFYEAAVYRIKITRAKENQGNKNIVGTFTYTANGVNQIATVSTNWEDEEESVDYYFIPYATDLQNVRSAVIAKKPTSVPAAIEFNTSTYEISVDVVSRADIAAFYQSID